MSRELLRRLLTEAADEWIIRGSKDEWVKDPETGKSEKVIGSSVGWTGKGWSTTDAMIYNSMDEAKRVASQIVGRNQPLHIEVLPASVWV